MRRLSCLCPFLIATALLGQSPPPPEAAEPAAPKAIPPSQEDQLRFLSIVRNEALTYSAKLPNFTCVRIGRLEYMDVPKKAAPKNDKKGPAAPAPENKATQEVDASSPQLAGLVEQRMTWFKENEKYYDPTSGKDMNIPGRSTVGEFIGVLKDVFTEPSNTQFKWAAMGILRQVPVAVIDYQIPKENSKLEITAGTAKIIAGYHGRIFANTVSGRILSINLEAEVPANFPAQEIRRLYEFGETVMSGEFYQMPLESRETERANLSLFPSLAKPSSKSPELDFMTTTLFQNCRRYAGPAGPCTPQVISGDTARIGTLALFAIAGSAGAAAPPDGMALEKTIAAMRESALAFDAHLPDFICTQVTHREVKREALAGLPVGARLSGSRGSTPATGTETGWKSVDSIEEQLTYFGHKESYKLVSLNGKRVKPGEEPDTGLKSSGEFGSTLGGIFDPLSRAEFKWKRTGKLRGQTVNVFEYSIAQTNSSSQLSAGSERVTVGYHGLLFVERESNAVIRVTTEAEVPADFPLQNVKRELDYGRANVGGQEYLLPLHSQTESRASEDFMQSGRTGGNSPLVTLRNTIDFKSFRKYGVDSELKPE